MGKGKRNSTIVISSSDDDNNGKFESRTNFRFSNSVPVKKSRKRAKRVSLPNSDYSGFDEVKRFCDEFDQGLTQYKVSSGSVSDKDLWVNKYKPRSLEELAVHKKKVEELKMWFEERVRNSDDDSCSNVILVSGQAGVGKSATIYAVASHLGAEVCEWTTPTPTIWKEHLHASSSGLRYMSKLDEFENFVERIRKYGLISSSLRRVSPASVIILIDDLPVVSGKISCGRLHRCLHLLLQSVRLPTAILINEYGKSDAADHHGRYWEELQSSLQNAGAFRVAFNPITVNSIRKILLKIRKVELFDVSDEQIDLIANTSGGDIRHAITSLQFLSLKPLPVDSFSVSKRLQSHSDNKANESGNFNDEVSLPFGKDANLSLFHALGKFLHNKRESEGLSADRDAILLKDKFVRYPLKMDAPELVLSQAHGESRLVADFLHENVLDFVSAEAIEDAGVVAAYLSDADLLLAPLIRTLSRKFGAENIIHSVAASVAVRGVLFGNTHPVSRWHAIRRPHLWKVEQSLWHNKYNMVTQSRDISSCTSLNDLSVMATEFKPALNWLGHRVAAQGAPEDGDYDGMSLDGEVKESDDDDIEEW